MSRGGARTGAGRRKKLELLTALLIGEHFDLLWYQESVRQALARHGKSNSMRTVRAAQSWAAMIPLGRRAKSSSAEEISEDIDFATGGNRYSSLPLLRPYGARRTLVTETITWCKENVELTISERQVLACWKEYKKFKKWAEINESLKTG